MDRHLHCTKSFATIERLEPRALMSGSMHAMGAAAPAASKAAHVNFLGTDVLSRLPATPQVNVATPPANGDVNPYGVAFIPKGVAKGGLLAAGDVLVSNFNASTNLQGTGTTIGIFSPTGQQSPFFQGQAGIGLTTALGVTKSGFIFVGNMPTTDGSSATVGQGSLIVLDKNGHQVLNLTDATNIDGPWDLAVNDAGSKPQVFVSNVLNGTVSRLDFKISHGGKSIALVKTTQIASGYTHRSDPAALELGPTGLAFDTHRTTLFVASTADEAIYAIPKASKAKSSAGIGSLVFQDSTHLHGPLGLAQAPNGDLIVANGDALNADPNQPSELVEITRNGTFVSQFSIFTDPAAPFGIAL
ncbi:MAG: hypothetical protein JWP03_1083, partial [Phycisphaerales bacterium]|nr:hypothetical protein [Phycisphaerales bacterium]